MICQQCKLAGDTENWVSTYYSLVSPLTHGYKKQMWHKAKALHASCITVDCYCQHRVKKPE